MNRPLRRSTDRKTIYMVAWTGYDGKVRFEESVSYNVIRNRFANFKSVEMPAHRMGEKVMSEFIPGPDKMVNALLPELRDQVCPHEHVLEDGKGVYCAMCGSSDLRRPGEVVQETLFSGGRREEG